MPGVQEAGSKGLFLVQLTQKALRFGREKSGFYGAKAR
jgi:hypothetical protein